ncbi:MAG: type II secretion system minor pseudopilin GspK [Xylophilus ampelinus]
MRRRASAARRRQGGAALLLAMLIVTLVASFSAAAAWRQWRAAEVEASERARVQAGWLLLGALDWSRLILREDARADARNRAAADTLSEPWAVPLQEARLSTFLAADARQAAEIAALTGDDDANVFLSGEIVDAQSRLNVANLAPLPAAAPPGSIAPDPALQAFQKLFALLGLPADQVVVLRRNLRSAMAATATATATAGAPPPAAGGVPVPAPAVVGPETPLMPQRAADLGWLGLPPATVAAIAPYVTVLPTPTPVNLNTASPPVLAAVLPRLSLGAAQQFAAGRALAPMRQPQDLAQRLGPETAIDPQLHGFGTAYFEVRGRLRLDRTVVEEQSLVRRNNNQTVVLWRQRGGLALDPAQAAALQQR